MSLYPSTLPRAFRPGQVGDHFALVDGSGTLENCRVLESSITPTAAPLSGNVTQTTSNSTGVTISSGARRGRITMFGTIPAATAAEFLLTNSSISTTSALLLSVERSTTNGGLASSSSCIVSPTTVASGSAIIRVQNPDPTFATDLAPIVHYYVMDT